jgi:hypothetical protein
VLAGENWKDHRDRVLAGEEVGEFPFAMGEIRPSNADYPEVAPVVWLTDDPNPGGPPEECCFGRIRLKIPTTDRRLASWGSFFARYAKAREPGISNAEIRERFDHIDTTMPECRARYAKAHWWTYDGAIPLGRIVEVEIISGAQVWWGALGQSRIGLGAAL